MARRKADLQAFAAETEQRLVTGLLDDIERLFDEKRKRLCDKIKKEGIGIASLHLTFT